MKKGYLSIFILILSLLVGCQFGHTPSQTTTTEGSFPDTHDPIVEEETIIDQVVLITEEPTAYEKVELALYEEFPKIKAQGNPFDYTYMYIIGYFTSPSGKVYKLPAFWYRDYEISLDTSYTGKPTGISGWPSTNPDEPQGLEIVSWTGEEHYRLRFLPDEAGEWTYTIRVNKESVSVQELTGTIDVQPNDMAYHGRITVEPKHKRNFVFSDGTTFIPIGQNTAWYTSSTRKTHDYDVWFSKMHENGANFTRIWMATWGFALHWGNAYNDFSSRMSQASRLDRVIELAHAYDIYIMLTLINHGQFSANVNPEWDNNPWNKKNGGILDFPQQFFYNKNAKEEYKNQLLYIIGRYGYSDHIMAWELWNEVDWTDGYKAADVFTWHQEMSQFLKENDPYSRLVTTSYKGETGGAYNLATIDYVNPHSYSYYGLNMNLTLPNRLENIWNTYQKPVLHSEIGINWENGQKTTEADPTGISLHQQSWAGMMGGGAGGAMNWWWDSWVHPNDLYYRFKGAATYAKELNMVGETYKQLRFEESIFISNVKVGLLGYQIDDRLYAYFYDVDWKHTNPNVKVKKNVCVTIPFKNGDYTLRVFDTVTGEVIHTENLTIKNNAFVYTFSEIGTDLAIILQ